ncbi:MAG: single-stranded-DNA-specific exonuclease RecJ [Eubacteriaceae bacterium]
MYIHKWIIRNRKVDYKKMSQQTGISEEICMILVGRNITSKEDINMFLNPNLDKLYDPIKMKDIITATDILIDKIKNNKKIRIISDYDVDGIISCYVLLDGLDELSANVDYVIPDRIKDGYGINDRIVKEAFNDGVDTIITCDNGIAAVSQVELAKKLGLTVIITDHHEVPFTIENENKLYCIPNADAIIDPKQKDCNYPFKELCGAGVVFKLIQYLFERMNISSECCYEYLQYISIATVCDIVELNGENRIIVKNGIKSLNNTKNYGLKELIRVNSIKDKEITSYTLGFILGPCLNAAGRLDSANKAMELLRAQTKEVATVHAQELYELNMKRRAMTEEGFDKILDKIENSHLKDDKVKIIYDDEVHESVVGIIAGRIKDKYNVPVIVLTKSKSGIKGSGRSIEIYNLYEELSFCKDLLDKFGGHSMAAGLSIQENNIMLLRDRLNEKFNISEEELIPKIIIDVRLPIHLVNKEFVREINLLEPFGKGNSKPIFGDKNVGIVMARIFGAKKNVLSLKLVSSNGDIVNGIFFGDINYFNKQIIKQFGDEELEKIYLGKTNKIKIDIAYFPRINFYKGNENLQIQINYIK